MDFVAVVDQVIALLRQRGRVTYRTLKLQFQLDDEALEDLKMNSSTANAWPSMSRARVLVWTGDAETPPSPCHPSSQPHLSLCHQRRRCLDATAPAASSLRGRTPPAHRAVL